MVQDLLLVPNHQHHPPQRPRGSHARHRHRWPRAAALVQLLLAAAAPAGTAAAATCDTEKCGWSFAGANLSPCGAPNGGEGTNMEPQAGKNSDGRHICCQFADILSLVSLKTRPK